MCQLLIWGGRLSRSVDFSVRFRMLKYCPSIIARELASHPKLLRAWMAQCIFSTEHAARLAARCTLGNPSLFDPSWTGSVTESGAGPGNRRRTIARNVLEAPASSPLASECPGIEYEQKFPRICRNECLLKEAYHPYAPSLVTLYSVTNA